MFGVDGGWSWNGSGLLRGAIRAGPMWCCGIIGRCKGIDLFFGIEQKGGDWDLAGRAGHARLDYRLHRHGTELAAHFVLWRALALPLTSPVPYSVRSRGKSPLVASFPFNSSRVFSFIPASL